MMSGPQYRGNRRSLSASPHPIACGRRRCLSAAECTVSGGYAKKTYTLRKLGPETENPSFSPPLVDLQEAHGYTHFLSCLRGYAQGSPAALSYLRPIFCTGSMIGAGGREYAFPVVPPSLASGKTVYAHFHL